MSVTSLLVPVDEGESRAMLAGTLALAPIIARASVLRARAARVDAVREELHGLLFERWNHESSRVPGLLEGLRRLVTGAKPVAPDAGAYDPYVQLFGRTFPVHAATPMLVAKRLGELLALDDAAFFAGLAADLSTFDPRAGSVLLASFAGLTGIEEALKQALDRTRGAVFDRRAGDALFGVAQVAAWSRPVWRLDGVMIAEVLRTAGSRHEWASPGLLFDDELVRDPGLAPAVAAISGILPSFRATGAVFSSADVQAIAGSLRLHWRTMLAATASEPAPVIAVRNLRLAAEAFAFADAAGTGLIEAAGVEWHERVS